jgi:hypothetical protein
MALPKLNFVNEIPYTLMVQVRTGRNYWNYGSQNKK